MELSTQLLLGTPALAVRDTVCAGSCRHRSEEEFAESTCLVFPYRGVYVRHVGRRDSVAEANQLLFFNQGEGYRVSHPTWRRVRPAPRDSLNDLSACRRADPALLLRELTLVTRPFGLSLEIAPSRPRGII